MMIRWLYFLLFISCMGVHAGHNDTNHYRNEAYDSVRQLPHPKYQKRLRRILKLAERVVDEEAKNDLYFEVVRTLRYFFDIKGFHQKVYLDKQTVLLHQGASALIAHQSNREMVYKKIGNQTCNCYQLSFMKKQYGVFKKRTTAYREMACWDLSHLFGCSDYIAPTLTLTFRDELASYQPYINAKVSRRGFPGLPKRHKNVDMLTFWKVCLFTFILSHGDLTIGNVAISKEGKLVLFDNEWLFRSINNVHFSRNTLFIPIVNFMVDWPQAKKGLSAQEARQLNEIVSQWKEVDLDPYLSHPLTKLELSDKAYSSLKGRMQKLIDFGPFSENQTFEELFLYFYPEFFNGVEEILPFVQRITKYSFTPYSVVYFIACCRGWWEGISAEDNQKLLDWAEKYHGG